MLNEFEDYLYKTKNITGFNLNGDIMHLMVGMYNIEYIDELLTYTLDWKKDIKTYWYKDIEVFKAKMQPLIDRFKEEYKNDNMA